MRVNVNFRVREARNRFCRIRRADDHKARPAGNVIIVVVVVVILCAGFAFRRPGKKKKKNNSARKSSARRSSSRDIQMPRVQHRASFYSREWLIRRTARMRGMRNHGKVETLLLA